MVSAYDYFRLYITTRIKKNKNFLAAITGPTGSGKTYSSLRIAEDLDPNFDVNRIVFSPLEFISLINNGKLKSGSVIVFDEAGVTLNSRKWQSQSNNFIQYILQTFRHRNYIVIFTSPDFGFIDSASRKLFHCQMETAGINFKNKLCEIKPFMIQIAQRTGEPYFKYLRAIIEGIGKVKIEKIQIPLPNKELVQKYEIKRKKFTDELNNKVEKAFEEKKELSNKQLLIYKKRQYHTIKKLRKKGMKWGEISEYIGSTGENLRRWFQQNGQFENE